MFECENETKFEVDELCLLWEISTTQPLYRQLPNPGPLAFHNDKYVPQGTPSKQQLYSS